jgi:polysaccharide pyruvyl transferase WcaK-like protein
VRILVEPSDYVLLNSGDTAMLEVGLTRLSALQPDALIEVLTDVPTRFPNFAPNVRPFAASGRHAYMHQARRPQNSPPEFLSSRQRIRRWIRKFVGAPDGSKAAGIQDFVDHVRRADLVVATGMGGITDAFPDFTFELLTTIELAIRCGALTAMMGQGIGPLTNPDLVALAKKVLPKVDLITLRERRASEPLLRALGVPGNRIVTTGDDAIEMAFDRRVVPGRLGRGLGVNLRVAGYAEVDAKAVASIRDAVHHAARLLDAPLIPVPISRVPEEADHATIGVLLSSETGEKSDGGSLIDSAHKVIDQIRMCRAVVTGSYHSAVFAMAIGAPVVGLVRSQYYTDKFEGLAEQFGVGCEIVRLERPDVESNIVAAIQRAWLSAEEVQPQLLAAAARQVDLSRAAYRRLNALISVRCRRRWLPPFLRRVPV